MSARPIVSASLEQRYADALGAYMRDADEEALLRAYELGRQIMDSGGGVLDLAATHQSSYEELIERRSAHPGRDLAIRRSHDFLAECLAPFEMAQRGFREANLRLLSANEQLETTNREIDRERATIAAVIASMHEGLIVADSEGVINAANGCGAELLATHPDGLIGHDIGEVVTLLGNLSADRVALERLRRAVRSGAPEPQTFELQTTEPARDLQVELFQVRGRLDPGTGVLLRDVTDERELSRAKDELVAIVSHELRNPLSNLIGFAELLRGHGAVEGADASYVEIIAAEGRRLAGLLDDFLDLQRIDRVADTVRPREVDLPPLLARLRPMVADDDCHELELSVAPELPQVRADPDRVWQVLLNLLSNARKYSPEGGPIEVSARLAEEKVEVCVADQGLGIPAEAMPRLFGEFYRVQTDDRRKIAGTGLGLSICRKIIRAHDGEIWAESDGPGRGARFLFTLPVVAGSAVAAAPGGSAVAAAAGSPGS
jgi:signal transduction histidine kinase